MAVRASCCTSRRFGHLVTLHGGSGILLHFMAVRAPFYTSRRFGHPITLHGGSGIRLNFVITSEFGWGGGTEPPNPPLLGTPLPIAWVKQSAIKRSDIPFSRSVLSAPTEETGFDFSAHSVQTGRGTHPPGWFPGMTPSECESNRSRLSGDEVNHKLS
jgi:hypothetical protein